MNLSKYIITTSLILGGIEDDLNGQKLPPIQLDRPDQTECPFITPPGYIQVENGFTIENLKNNQKNYFYPASLWKYGVNEHFELRLITELTTEKKDHQLSTGLQPITFGLKTTLFNEKGLLPRTSLIGHITSSGLGSKDFHSTYIAPSLRFTMQHTLSERVSLSYNLGAEWNGETAEHTYIYTFTTGISITDRLGGYMELYGFIPQDQPADHRFDGGLTYLVQPDFMLDLSGGGGLQSDVIKNYVSVGISYRFNLIKN